MKKLVVIALVLFTTPSARAQQLGAGFDQHVDDMYTGLVMKSRAKWVRAFVSVPRNYLTFDSVCINCVNGVLEGNLFQNSDDVGADDEVLAIASIQKFEQLKAVSLGDQPVKVILSLKLDFSYNSMGVPVVGTPAATYLIKSIEELLTQKNLGAYVDILVIGNEPEFEVPVYHPSDPDNYYDLLNAIINDVATMRTPANGWNYEIFTGALDRAYEMGTMTPPNPILTKVIETTNTNANVAGIDLHEHVTYLSDADNDLNFVRNTEGVSKKIIVTEFTLESLWDLHANDMLGSWGTKHNYSPSMHLYEWLNVLMDRAGQGYPIRSAQFLSYFNAQSWYPQGWFTQFMSIFAKYGVYAATYGVQSTPVVPVQPLQPGGKLWVLNFTYNGTLLGMNRDGFFNRNPIVYPEYQVFVKAQAKE